MMLGIDLLKLVGGGTVGGGPAITLHDDTFHDIQYNGGVSFASWSLGAAIVNGVPNGSFPTYTWLPSGAPVDYEVIILGTGFSTGASGTYPCNTGVTLTVTRSTQGQTTAHFSAKIQLAANPGVYLAEASITIRAQTINGSEP